MKNFNQAFPGQAPNNPSFTTPKKQTVSQPFHSFLPPFVSSKLKDIASKIRTSANKRFRMREQGGLMKLVFWSEMKEVSESTQTTSQEKRSDKDLTPYQLEKLIKKKRAAVSKMEASHIEKFKQIQELLKDLEIFMLKNNELRAKLKLVRDQNRNTKQRTRYGLFLKKIYQQQLKVVNKLQSWLQFSQLEKQKVIQKLSRISILDQLISNKKLQNKFFDEELSKCRQEIQKIVDEGIPFSMVNCIFQVGILNQQIFILGQQKKEKLKQKDVNKLNKASQILSRREIHIQCVGSQIVEYSTLVAIYMHCKSLTIPHVLTLMNELSFFSTEFKKYYHYPLLETYIKNLILLSNNIQTQFNETQILKKKLVIFVKGEHEGFLRWIMRMFQRQKNQYYVYLNPMIMNIQIALQQEEPCNHVEQRDTNTSDQNQLQINFHDFCLK